MFEGEQVKKIGKSAFEKTFLKNAASYQRLQTAAHGIIENSLTDCQIKHLPISSRLKSIDSAWQKYQSKNYTSPFSDMTDFLGFRIVVFLESDISIVRDTLKSNLLIDDDKSIDKLKPNRPDSVGYRSLHLICSLGDIRASLPEYENITQQNFEIQIRTVLQHAWAEIEHQKNYKGDHVLPADLQHRLMRLAGSLEIIDMEFSSISATADEYVAKILKGSAENSDDGLSGIAIDAYLQEVFGKYGAVAPSLSSLGDSAEILEELSDFGVRTNADFRNLIEGVNIDILIELYNGDPDISIHGLIRDMMIFFDAARYFEEAFKNRWGGTSIHDIPYLKEGTGREDIATLLRMHNIELYDEEADSYYNT
ncbi:MAG: GTP pyrophosphokinase [Rhodobacterales bacterium]